MLSEILQSTERSLTDTCDTSVTQLYNHKCGTNKEEITVHTEVQHHKALFQKQFQTLYKLLHVMKA